LAALSINLLLFQAVKKLNRTGMLFGVYNVLEYHTKEKKGEAYETCCHQPQGYRFL
jgi:hypothetical protein